MAQGRFRVGITRDNLRPDGKPIFDESAFRILDDAGIEYEFLPESRDLVKSRVPKNVVNQEVLGCVPYFHL